MDMLFRVVVVIGTFAYGAVFSIQIEGGKRNNSGLQVDITGVEGDLKISNELSFQNPDDNKVEGSRYQVRTKGCPLPPSMPAFSVWLISMLRTQMIVRTALTMRRLLLTR
jgi:hypothetical protein